MNCVCELALIQLFTPDRDISLGGEKKKNHKIGTQVIRNTSFDNSGTIIVITVNSLNYYSDESKVPT